MTETTTGGRPSKKATLAATAAKVTKTILGAVQAAPETRKMPQTVAEIHVSPSEMIPAGTVLTDDLLIEAGIDDEDVADLIDQGHVKLVDVLTTPAAPIGAN